MPELLAGAARALEVVATGGAAPAVQDAPRAALPAHPARRQRMTVDGVRVTRFLGTNTGRPRAVRH